MVPFFIVLLGSEDTVAGIAETWEDVVMIIELTIEGSCVDRHIRMSLVDDFNAFRCGYEAHELNVLYAFFLHHVDGCDSASAGCEHRVDDDEIAVVHIRQLAVVFDRLGCFRIAVEADNADSCRRHQFKKAVHHAEACAEDRNDADFLAGYARPRIFSSGVSTSTSSIGRSRVIS